MSSRRLRQFFFLFFCALVIPAVILSWKAYEQLKWEAFYQYQQDAQLLVQQIDNSLNKIIANEESRADTDYTFLVLAGDPSAKFVQRSELSKFPVESNFPGIVGYFQLDEHGVFSSPLLPQEYRHSALYGVDQVEQQLRTELQSKLQNVLAQNQLVSVNFKDKLAVVQDNQQAGVSGLKSNRNSSVSVDAVESPALDDSALDMELANNEAENIAGLDISTIERKRQQELILAEEKKKQEKQQRQENNFFNLQSKTSQSKIASEYLNKSKGSFPLKEKVAQQLDDEKTLINAPQKSRKSRVEKNYSPQQSVEALQENSGKFDNQSIQINLFESELEPFRFSLLSSGHFVAYRQVWRNRKRVIQGAILSTDEFLQTAIQRLYVDSGLSQLSLLNVVYGDNLLKTYQGEIDRSKIYSSRRSSPLKGKLLLASTLSEPFNQLTLVFNITNMPAGAGSSFILLVASCLLLILTLGTYLLYRLTLRQLMLAQQQQDFVSAVSHELKTPLTSIRMYGEILKQGWVTEEKKLEYYDFIFNESERLSRLISNVLQISKVNRNALLLDLKSTKISELQDLILSKIDSQIRQSQFLLNMQVSKEVAALSLNIDSDAFIQIMINLVDNSIKYAAKAKNKQIDIGFTQCNRDDIEVSVRDYGPGIARTQRKKIFELFYRSGDELTRECTGTGIGLALVKELSNAMGAAIEVKNHAVGVEFTVKFKRVK